MLVILTFYHKYTRINHSIILHENFSNFVLTNTQVSDYKPYCLANVRLMTGTQCALHRLLARIMLVRSKDVQLLFKWTPTRFELVFLTSRPCFLTATRSALKLSNLGIFYNRLIVLNVPDTRDVVSPATYSLNK